MSTITGPVEASVHRSASASAPCDRPRGGLARRPGVGRDGDTIRFAVGDCSLGGLLVAQSEHGLCAILLGDEPRALASELQQHFPGATAAHNDAAFEGVLATVAGFVEAPHIDLDLPLDLRGTAFQRRVWTALQGIPVGATASYAQIARRIGMPTAARAVAQACAANRLAVAVPCHRVVRANAAPSGYRWGVARKQALLAREASARARARGDP